MYIIESIISLKLMSKYSRIVSAVYEIVGADGDLGRAKELF